MMRPIRNLKGLAKKLNKTDNLINNNQSINKLMDKLVIGY
jgi:hypothetical protein